jgi:pimeloyl-ACP methyl ester carboxylesterase/predicted glycosyltransferase
MRAKLPHTEGRIDRDGISLHYEVYGKGEHTIVFIPTWSFVHSRAYKAQIPYFSEHFRCITYDPRGNGKSDKPADPEDHRLDLYVEDVIAVMDACDVDKAIFYGLSFSTRLVTILATYFPERTEAAVLVGSSLPLVPTYEYKSWEKWDKPSRGSENWDKYTRDYWRENYPDFTDFFSRQIFNEPHSTKQIEDTIRWANQTTGEVMVGTMDGGDSDKYLFDEAAARAIHGDNDIIAPSRTSQVVTELVNGEVEIIEGAGHNPAARFPARVNTLIRDFLHRHLGSWKPTPAKRTSGPKKALYLSSPIGLGHARRDLAISRELQAMHPGLQIDWLAQDPVTRFLQENEECIHPASDKLANESQHIESEAGEHDLHAFQTIRNMDEILIANFMIFQEVLEQEHYDLVIADEAWDVDHYWHEHPELKKAQIAWLTDFVGWVPMPAGGDHEAFLTSDYNAEMIGHIENHPGVRDRAIFVGNPGDIIPQAFGADLPAMRDWIPQHFDFCGYVLGRHPSTFGERTELRERFDYADGETVCIVTVGGSGVGGTLIQRILDAYPIAKRKIADLRMIVVTGPRLDAAHFTQPQGVEFHSFVPDLDTRLAACDLALVQGGLSTTMELAAAGTPFLYFPLRNHFEQNFHVAHRLDQYQAGRKMIFDESDPDAIAAAMVEELARPRSFLPVEADGARRAAGMLSDLL